MRVALKVSGAFAFSIVSCAQLELAKHSQQSRNWRKDTVTGSGGSRQL
jgi:hypothetical protein